MKKIVLALAGGLLALCIGSCENSASCEDEFQLSVQIRSISVDLVTEMDVDNELAFCTLTKHRCNGTETSMEETFTLDELGQAEHVTAYIFDLHNKLDYVTVEMYYSGVASENQEVTQRQTFTNADFEDATLDLNLEFQFLFDL